MSDHQSSNTLLNSVSSWTFTKTNRFENGLYRNLETHSIYNIPDNKTSRYTTQGFGKRYDLLPLKGKHSPPPNSYRLKSMFEVGVKDRKGPTISEKYSLPVNRLFNIRKWKIKEFQDPEDITLKALETQKEF